MRRQAACPSLVGFALAVAWTATDAVAAGAAEDGSTSEGRFALQVEACPEVPAESVRRILTVEIGDLLLTDLEGLPPGSERLTIRCSGDIAWVDAAGPAGGASLQRSFRLDGFPGDAAPRALALAGLELLAARSSIVRERMASRHKAASSPTRTLTAPSAPPPVLEVPLREVHIGLAGTWRTFLGGHGATAAGGQVQFGSTIGRRWMSASDVEIAGTRRRAASQPRAQPERIGDTSAMLLSCGTAFGLRGRSSNLGASLALGGRIGVARLSGNSANTGRIDGRTVWRPWGGPMMAASVSARIGRFSAALTAEAGCSLLAAEGQVGGATVIAVRDFWAAISLGGSYRP